MTKLVDLVGLENRRTFGFLDDFCVEIVTGDLWTTVLTDTGTAAVGDAAGGIASLVPSDGTVADNDEAYLKTTNELFKFAADKPAIFEVRAQYTEANTDDANVAFGFMDAVAANAILDNGAGPAASYSGAVFFKVDGGTTWNCETSIAGAQTTTALTAAQGGTAGGASYKTFRITFDPYSSTAAKVNFFIDGVLMASHDFTYTSATEMCAFAGVKNGGTNLETLNVDYIAAYELR